MPNSKVCSGDNPQTFFMEELFSFSIFGPFSYLLSLHSDSSVVAFGDFDVFQDMSSLKIVFVHKPSSRIQQLS